MTPAEQAAALYEREPCARSFREDLEAHLVNGWVYASPTAFLMARPIPSGVTVAERCNPWNSWPFEDCDCVHLYACAGDMAEIWRQFPPEWEGRIKSVAFERRNIPRLVDVPKFRRLCETLKTWTPTTPAIEPPESSGN